jgi:5,10-methylenetetrahydromethanopterin reductase
MGAQLVRSRSAFPQHPSASNLRWLREAGFEVSETHDPTAIHEDQARDIADAFGLFGPPERCAERLLQAQEKAGIEHAFLFPAHDLAGGYDMPEAQLQAFAKVIRPRLGG